MANLTEMAKIMNVEPKTKKIENKAVISKKETSQKRRTWLEDAGTEAVSLIDPQDIANWEFHDRPENEIGDIRSLANEFISLGQQQPCIVRPTQIGSKNKYELIIGERRWRAAIMAGVKLKAIIKDISDNDAALSQAAENNNRKDLSDYAKSMSYARLIENKIITRKDLIEKLGRNKQYVSSLLSFADIPKEIINEIGDMSNVSYRTGETIKRLSNKGQTYIDAIISKAKQISTGVLGNKKLPDVIEKAIDCNNTKLEKRSNKVSTINGRHLFTWRKDNNDMQSIHFPKDISDLFVGNQIDFNQLSTKIKGVINDELSKIK